jgi:hypothetical protein
VLTEDYTTPMKDILIACEKSGTITIISPIYYIIFRLIHKIDNRKIAKKETPSSGQNEREESAVQRPSPYKDAMDIHLL